MTRRVLIPMHSDWAGSDNWNKPYRYVRQWLLELGYEPHVVEVQEDSSTLTGIAAGSFAFAVVPNLTTTQSWSASSEYAKALDGTLPFPTLALGGSANGGVKFRDTFGADSYSLGKVDRQVTWNGANFWAHVADQDLNPALQTTILVSTENGKAAAWVMHGTTSNVYAEASGNNEGTNALWYVLLQEALERGDITALPARSLKFMFDLDDIPALGGLPNNTLEDMESFYALQQEYKLPVTWGLQADSNWDNATPEMISFIDSRTPDKDGLIYAIEHAANNYGTGMNADQVDTAVSAAIAKLSPIQVGKNADGKDSWGYRYFNTNEFSHVFMDVAVDRSYGLSVLRADANSRNFGVGEPGALSGVTRYRGLTIVGSIAPWLTTDIDAENPGTGAWSYSSKAAGYVVMTRNMLTLCPLWNSVTYLHGKNFMVGHSGSTDPGGECLYALCEIARRCSHIFRFAHPSELASG